MLGVEMPKAFSKNMKELVGNLIIYFEKERDAGGPLLPLTAVRERVANALNISLSTVSRVSQELNSGEDLSCPKNTGPKSRPIVDVDDFTQIAIRNVIYEMYRNKQHITKESLLELLKDRDIYQGGLSSLGKILGNIARF